MVYQWFKQARAKNIPLSGPLIQEKALEYAQSLDLSDFKASNGWLESLRSKFSVGFFKVCGESASVDQAVVDDFRANLSTIIGEYCPENVFNADETGLFFRTLPDKTLAQKGEVCKGGKLAKERITVMLACSSTGEKLKPLVIGKSKNPRCFKNINIDNLPVYWQSNKKAWMTEFIFLEWIKKLNKQMKLKNRKILLFLDNATSHSSSLSLSNIQLRFLPPNTTSKLQPLDLGIIRAFKARYRKHMMKFVITKIDSSTECSSLTKDVSLLDAVHWISKSWNETKDTTIKACFRDTGFPLGNPTDVSAQEDPDEDDDDIPLSELLRVVRQSSAASDNSEVATFADMDEIEADLPIEETYEGEWEKTLVEQLKKRDEVGESSESDAEEIEENECVDNTGFDYTYEDMFKKIKHMINFSNAKDDRFLKFLMPMKSMTEDTIVRKKMSKKQGTLDNFF